MTASASHDLMGLMYMSEMPDYSFENRAGAPADSSSPPVRRPDANAARSLIEYLMQDATDRCSSLIVAVGDLDEFSLVQIRQQIEAGTVDGNRIVVPFNYRGATMKTILLELAERLRLNKKYSLAGAARLASTEAVAELFSPRDDRVVLLVHQADRMPIDTFRHIGSALETLADDDVPGAVFFLCVGEEFFDSQRGAILLQTLGSERIVSNVQFVDRDLKPKERRRAVPHPSDVLTVSPGVDGLEDALPDMGEGDAEDDDPYLLESDEAFDGADSEISGEGDATADEPRSWEDVASEPVAASAPALSVDGPSVSRKSRGWRRFFGG